VERKKERRRACRASKGNKKNAFKDGGHFAALAKRKYSEDPRAPVRPTANEPHKKRELVPGTKRPRPQKLEPGQLSV